MSKQRLTTGLTVALAVVLWFCLSTGVAVASPDRLPLDSTHLEGTELDQPANTTNNLTSTTTKEITTTSTGDIPTKIGDISYASDNSVSINEMIATDDGNYLLVGGNLGDTEVHPSVRKVTADGSVLWERTYTDASNQSFTSVIQTEAGNFVLSGVTETADSYTGLGVKIDSEGTKLWEIEGGSSEEVFRDVEQTTANRYLFVSEYNSSEGDENAGVLKTTADGEEVWSFKYWDRSERNDQGFDGIERVEPDRFALIGDAYIDDQLDAWAFEIDSNGEIISSETFGHPTLNDNFNDITITTDNNPVYVGFRNGNYDTAAGEYISSDAWIYYDGIGSWSKDVAVDNINVFRSVSTDADRIVAGGPSGPEAGANRNRLAVEYDTEGAQNWVLNGEETGDQSIDTVLVDGSDTYLAGEEQAPDADTYDGKLFRYTSDSSGGDDDSSIPDDPTSGDGSIVSTDRTIDSSKAVAGETIPVTVTATFNGTVNDAQINDQISPALPATQVEITDSGGASVAAYQESTGIVTANYGNVSDVTLSYEVTVPDDVSTGTTYDFTGGEVRNRDIGAVSTIAGDSSIEVITNPLLRYAGPSGVVGPGGLGDAAADFRAGEIGPGTLGEVAAAFRSGKPVE